MMTIARRFASLRLTVVALAALAGLAVAGRVWAGAAPAWMALPAVALTVNLLAALATNRRLRTQRALAVFHWALLSVAGLIALSALARFEGTVEIVEGAAFDPGTVRVTDAAPFATTRVNGVDFVQESLVVDYLPGLTRQQLRSTVRIDEGRREVSEHSALDVNGYRFSPTPNKGFAVLLTWRDANGNAINGAVHLPSYPVYEWRQETPWRTPAGEAVTVLFRPAQRVPMEAPWTLSRARAVGAVTVRTSQGDHVLTPGVPLGLAGGELVLDGVRLWMGYSVDHDPAMPWLFLAAALGVVALVWHVLGESWRPTRVPARRADEVDARVLGRV